MAPQGDLVAPGTQIGGYRVLRELARGGMGCVYLATEDSLGGRMVAIKLIGSGPTELDQELRTRFLREARSLAQLRHPNIVRVFSAGEHDGQPYFAMEYVPGRDLGSFVEECRGQSEAERIDSVVRVVSDVARAIHHAHTKGIVHRDLKPRNILIAEESDEAMVLDFGIARVQDTERTQGMVALGTPGYQAPEQLDPQRRVRDELIDVWALGVLLYRCLTDRQPFAGDDTLAISMQIIHAEPPAPRTLDAGIPEELETLVLECLAKDPRARPATALEVAERLEALRRGATTGASLPPRTTRGEVATGVGTRATRPGSTAPAASHEASRWGVRPSLLALLALSMVIGVASLGAPRLGGWKEDAKPSPPHAARVAAVANKLDMVEVPGGPFLMGCDDSVEDCAVGALRLTTVDVPRFWIDRTEVTKAQYRKCVEAGRCPSGRLGMAIIHGEPQPEHAEHCNWPGDGEDDHPMNCVSWREAQAYCEWAGKRLPTEAEWEKAARGGDGRKYPWGNDGFENQRVANIADDTARRLLAQITVADGYHDGYVGTAPVGSFPRGASPYGALDMIGNVWEWVADGGEDPLGRHGMRGGSWSTEPAVAKIWFTSRLDPDHRSGNDGFRCAWTG